MTEADLKRDQGAALKKRLRGLVLRHEDKFRAGIPDTSVTWGRPGARQTVWIETKYDRPGARARLTAIQERTLKRLDGLLVLYQECEPGRRTIVLDYATGRVLLDALGFAHQTVADLVADLAARRVAPTRGV